jgi:hypothetical protein
MDILLRSMLADFTDTSEDATRETLLRMVIVSRRSLAKLLLLSQSGSMGQEELRRMYGNVHGAVWQCGEIAWTSLVSRDLVVTAILAHG